ncbi:hypothetical protein KUTeg_009140 [Tegillarca granosa]|uniref:Uncharacterized protein n=1 Tax=Tegillarca granosa TaxID=220873 RepID=A0ABQ9F7J4_TEGGR|nr:hypothetical protein KUTeg_009140 [Tegillarca granosa]
MKIKNHFGRTNLNTPVTSQNLFDSDTEESEDGFCVVDLAERARWYLEENEGSDTNESSYSSDEENRNDIINHILLPIDDPNLYKIKTICDKGCGCRNNCVSNLNRQEIYSHIINIREMDIYIMGSLVQYNDGTTKKDHGVSPRTHGNTGKKPRHSLKFNDIKLTVQFISNYADESGLPQPAAPRGRDGVPPVYIPSNMTKKVSILCMSRVTKEGDLLNIQHFAIYGTIAFHILDGEPKKLNFLINEDETIGLDGSNIHAPDSVFSMVDWALENHNSGETVCSIHADNFGGQNKKQYVLGYFMWRVMTGQHSQIYYKVQVPGHSRCLID